MSYIKSPSAQNGLFLDELPWPLPFTNKEDEMKKGAQHLCELRNQQEKTQKFKMAGWGKQGELYSQNQKLGVTVTWEIKYLFLLSSLIWFQAALKHSPRRFPRGICQSHSLDLDLKAFLPPPPPEEGPPSLSFRHRYVQDPAVLISWLGKLLFLSDRKATVWPKGL